MSKEEEWKNEKLWIEVENQNLYPPKYNIMIPTAEELVEKENFYEKKVLDNGCGVGWLGEILKRKGAAVIGSDISGTLLHEASKKISVVKATSYNLPFNNDSFDYVLSFDVIMILEKPKEVLHEMNRILKKKGKLYLSIVNPISEKWDITTGLCYKDSLSVEKEERPWVFNLKDGRKFIKHYYHRSRDFYETIINQFFTVENLIEPILSTELQENGRYAGSEYLMMELIKK